MLELNLLSKFKTEHHEEVCTLRRGLLHINLMPLLQLFLIHRPFQGLMNTDQIINRIIDRFLQLELLIPLKYPLEMSALAQLEMHEWIMCLTTYAIKIARMEVE